MPSISVEEDKHVLQVLWGIKSFNIKVVSRVELDRYAVFLLLGVLSFLYRAEQIKTVEQD